MKSLEDSERVTCDGCPPVGGPCTAVPRPAARRCVPICFSARSLVGTAKLVGTVPMWEWIGDGAATAFSYWCLTRTEQPTMRQLATVDQDVAAADQ